MKAKSTNVSQARDEAKVLPNVNQVFEYLFAQGWRCTRPTVNRHAKAGKIPANGAGEFSISDVETYAVSHFERVGGTAKAADAAPSGDEPTAVLPEVSMELGLDAALGRLRAAEFTAYSEWKKGLGQGAASAPMFRSYSQSIELLRKAEKNLLDLQKERKTLMPASEVKEWMVHRIMGAKTILLNLPGKLAPQLEGLPWPKIQERLEEEIRNALERLAADS